MMNNTITTFSSNIVKGTEKSATPDLVDTKRRQVTKENSSKIPINWEKNDPSAG